MTTTWKKTFLIALPLAGLLISAPAAEAHKPHKHKRDPHCRTYKKHGWYDRGRYNDHYSRRRYDDYDYYEGRRGWYGGRRPDYDNDRYYPSRYPYDTYYNRSYYGDFPRWLIFDR